MMIPPGEAGQAPAGPLLCGDWFALSWCGPSFGAPSPAVADPSGFPNRLIARIPMLGMVVATRWRRPVEGQSGSCRSPPKTGAPSSITQKGVCHETKTRISIGLADIRIADHGRDRGR